MIRETLKKIYHSLPLNKKMKRSVYRWYEQYLERKPRARTDIYSDWVDKLNVTNPFKISVVIPNYNYEKYLIERIDSVLFQSYPIYELIILDDCSTDHSMELIQKKISHLKTVFPIRLICNERNSGSVFAQWQRGFAEAKGDYVWIAEADDSCSPRFLETVIKGFEDPDTVISYCESLTMDGENHILMENLRSWIDQTGCGKWENNYTRDGITEIVETMCINNTIANVSSVVFRNGDYQKFIEKAKKFTLAGDWYIYMRILESGKIAYNSQSLNYHRMQPQGMTMSTTHQREYEEIVWIQNYALGHYPITEETKRKVLDRRERERIRFGL